jgi:hypothetical protein
MLAPWFEDLGQPPHLDGSTIKELGTGKGRIEEGFARARRTLRNVSLQPNAQTESATTGMCTCDAREVRVYTHIKHNV